ncbi:unnamed protein product, partial [Symbiodinium necroappetens]
AESALLAGLTLEEAPALETFARMPWPLTELLAAASRTGHGAAQQAQATPGRGGICACDLSLWPVEEARSVAAAQKVLEEINGGPKTLDALSQALESPSAKTACGAAWGGRLATAEQLLSELWGLHPDLPIEESLPLAASLRDSGWAFDPGVCLVGARRPNPFHGAFCSLWVLCVGAHELFLRELNARLYQAMTQSTEQERLCKTAMEQDTLRMKSRGPQDRLFRQTLREPREPAPRPPCRTRPRSAVPPARQRRIDWIAAQRAKMNAWRRAQTAKQKKDLQEPMDGRKTCSGPCSREADHSSSRLDPGSAPLQPSASIPRPNLRCRLLGRAENAALMVPDWQESFMSDLTTLLEHLLGLPEEAFFLRVRHNWHKGNVVAVQISFDSCATPAHAELLERSLRDGSLRRMALRSCTRAFSAWPVSKVLRQFLLRDMEFEAFWVTERHEWHIPNFLQALQSPSAFLASQPFELGGGANMTLLLHPNCSSKTELGFAAMTLSAAGHQRPTSPFLLTAGSNGEIWAGPFGRDAADRFYAGGPLCASEETEGRQFPRPIMFGSL